MFPKRRGRINGVASWCKSCGSISSDRKYNSLHEWVNTLKLESGCKDCGYNKDPVALDYDHLDHKVKGVAELIRSRRSKEQILSEISRCEVVCANCHRIRTKKRNSARKLGATVTNSPH